MLTIFIVTIASLGTFSARAKLWPGSKKHRIFDERGTDDKFVIVFASDEKTGAEQEREVLKIFKKHHASEVYDKNEDEL